VFSSFSLSQREREYVCFNFVMKYEEKDFGAWREHRWCGEKGKPEKAREKSEDLIR